MQMGCEMGKHSPVPGMLAHIFAGKGEQAAQGPRIAVLSQGDPLGQVITAGMLDKILFGNRYRLAESFRPKLGLELPEMGEQHGIHRRIAAFKVSPQPFGGVAYIDPAWRRL